MTCKEVNELLIKGFPHLEKAYIEEVEWQEGDDTGSHTVYGDVFTPYIKRVLEGQQKCEIKIIFDFLEKLLEKKDFYIDEVIAFSVLESIKCMLCNSEELILMLGQKTKRLLDEI